MIVFVIFFAFGTVPLLKVVLKTDYPLVVVSSGSMEPTISKGDILIIKWKDPADIEAGSHTDRTGDVLLYDSVGVWDDPADQPIVHRVVEKLYDDEEDKYYFVTQGDDNSRTDPPGLVIENPIPEDKVIGVVAGKIPFIGWIKLGMSRLPGVSTIVVIGLGIFLVISIASDLVKSSKDKETSEDIPEKVVSHDEIE